jgi:hypothetical protein
MTVAEAVDGEYHTLTGTLAEVVTALNARGVGAHKVLAIYYDSGASKTTAVFHR